MLTALLGAQRPDSACRWGMVDAEARLKPVFSQGKNSSLAASAMQGNEQSGTGDHEM